MVHGMLVTGPSESLLWFALRVGMIANRHERREQTDHYSVMNEDVDVFVRLGKCAGCTVQEIVRDADGEEQYEDRWVHKHGMRWDPESWTSETCINGCYGEALYDGLCYGCLEEEE